MTSLKVAALSDIGGHSSDGVWDVFALRGSFHTVLFEGTVESLDHLDHLSVIKQSMLVVRDDDKLIAIGALFAQCRVCRVAWLLNLRLVVCLEHMGDASQTKSGPAAGHDLWQSVLQVELERATVALKHRLHLFYFYKSL